LIRGPCWSLPVILDASVTRSALFLIGNHAINEPSQDASVDADGVGCSAIKHSKLSPTVFRLEVDPDENDITLSLGLIPMRDLLGSARGHIGIWTQKIVCCDADRLKRIAIGVNIDLTSPVKVWGLDS
jgi:hypothetical protein